MKSSISLALLFGLVSINTLGQTFLPSAGSSLTNGNIGSTYIGQSIIINVPTTITVTGQQIIDGVDEPIALTVVQGSIDPNADYELAIDTATFNTIGLPPGLTSNCNGCSIAAGSYGSIELSGTPTMAGTSTFDIISQTTGETVVDTGNGQMVLTFGGTIDIGLGFPFPVSPLADVLNAEDYTIQITNTNNLPSISVATTATSSCNGVAEVITYSGAAPFTYTFSTGQSGPEAVLSSLCPDVYSVGVEDANGGVVNATFVITESSNVFSNMLGIPGDTLYSNPLNNCDLDYFAPIDSFNVSQLIMGGQDTLAATWEVWQQGELYLLLGEYPNVSSSNMILSLTIFCLNGRSEVGSFQLFSEAPEITASIGDYSESSFPMSVYPNPTNSDIYIQTETRLSQVWVTDLSGRRLISMPIGRTTSQADLGSLSNGVYLIEAIAEEGTRAIKKVLKQ